MSMYRVPEYYSSNSVGALAPYFPFCIRRLIPSVANTLLKAIVEALAAAALFLALSVVVFVGVVFALLTLLLALIPVPA
jgi:hypothetical protein